jgi:hypothetical protein
MSAILEPAPKRTASLPCVLIAAAGLVLGCGEGRGEFLLAEPGDEAEQVGSTEQQLACAVTVPGEILIRNVGVLEDSGRGTWSGNTNLTTEHDGAWSFGRLFSDMIGPNTDYTPHRFLDEWLAEWDVDDTVNNDFVPNRAAGMATHIRNAWPKKADGTYDLTRAPFRLAAISHRFDLRDLNPAGPDTAEHDLRDPPGAGELRFVFNLIDPVTLDPKDFIVILEYNIPVSANPSNADVRAWAWKWHNALCGKTVGSAAYNQELADLTVGITRKMAVGNKADGTWRRPNNSNIVQVRTNDYRVLGATQEFREFKLPIDLQGSNSLSHFYLEKTINKKWDAKNDPLADFVNQNQAAIIAEDYKIPQEFGGHPDFQAGNMSLDDTAPIDGVTPTARSYWNAPQITSANARHKFSLNTCNGCHGRESGISLTQTKPFHIFPRAAGAQAALSAFMTGTTTVDPVDSTKSRTFNEQSTRRTDFENYLIANP